MTSAEDQSYSGRTAARRDLANRLSHAGEGLAAIVAEFNAGLAGREAGWYTVRCAKCQHEIVEPAKRPAQKFLLDEPCPRCGHVRKRRARRSDQDMPIADALDPPLPVAARFASDPSASDLPAVGSRSARLRTSVVESTVLVSAAVVGLAVATRMHSPVRSVAALWFLLVCPGLAIVRLLRLRDLWAVATLAVAVSIGCDTMVAEAMLYTHTWSPGAALVTLMSISGLALLAARLPDLWFGTNDAPAMRT